MLDEFFHEGNVRDNIDFLEKSFDCWCDIDDIEKFFDDRVSLGDRTKRDVNKHQQGKIILYFDEKNIFKDCLKAYGKTDSGKRKFPMSKIILLYAFLKYLLNSNNISDKDFRRRIRIVNNLVNVSDGTDLSDSENRQSGNQLPAILKQVDSIICNGCILKLQDASFNAYQLSEEREKLEWTSQHPALAESLFELEDHYLLYGQIAILGLENQQYFKRFISLFKCDYDKINCALVAMGDYFQIFKGRYLFGADKPQSWKDLFHKSSSRSGFGETQKNLLKLLKRTNNFNDDFLDKIISEYIAYCERNNFFEWSYYYVKYPVFRPNRYGKYDWQNFDEEPYQFIAWLTDKRWSDNAYQPFLKELEGAFDSCQYDAYNERLIVGEKFYIKSKNAAFVIYNINTDKVVKMLEIQQNNGVDSEDRLKKAIKILSKLSSRNVDK